MQRKLKTPTPGFSPTLTAAHFPDLFGLLDTTAASVPGQRHGFRTFAHTHLVQQGGPLDLGRVDNFGVNNGYRRSRKRSVSLALDFSQVTDTQRTANISLCGLMEDGTACPDALLLVHGEFYLSIATQSLSDPLAAPAMVHNYTLDVPTKPKGLCRVDYEIDADTGTVTSFIDGFQTNATNLQSVPLAAGQSFNPSRHCPWGLGLVSGNAAVENGGRGGSADITYCGYRVGDQLLYANLGPGKPQTRLDGSTITDFKRYFDKTQPGTIAFLPFNDNIDDAMNSRVLTSWPTASVYALDLAHRVNDNSTSPGRFRNLSITSRVPGYGAAIRTGLTYDLDVDGEYRGGAHGLGSLYLGANYRITAKGVFAGCDAPISLYMASAGSIDAKLDGHYRDGVRLHRCDLIDIQRLFSPHYGKPEFGIHATRTSLSIGTASFDNEQIGGGSQFATIYVTPQDAADSPCSGLIINNIVDAFAGPNAATVVLGAATPNSAPRSATIRSLRPQKLKAQKWAIRNLGAWTLDAAPSTPAANWLAPAPAN